jgi:hypothetical protein
LNFGSAEADFRLPSPPTIVHEEDPSPARMTVDVPDDMALDASMYHERFPKAVKARTQYRINRQAPG